MIKLLVAIAFLGVNFYTYNFMARTAVIPPRASFDEFPLQIDEWHCDHNEPLDPKIKENLGATDTLICEYVKRDPAARVGFYVGYHATQVREEGGGAGENSIHPPAHCLPGSGWSIILSETVPISLEGLPDDRGQAKRLVIAKGKARQLVYYWYQMQGDVIGHDWQKILYVGLGRALQGRSDGALVRFTIPFAENDVEAADAAFREFAPKVAPLLSRFVPN